ncbi:MAG: hypothetical protein QNK24_03785 [Desulfuromusa sp.]|nr:hypothetical protein [Desulfuromusa sp.]
MSKWHLIVDVALCVNCCNCFLAVKDEYCGNTFPGYSASQPHHGHRWFDIQQVERGSGSLMDVAYLPVTCNQCANPPCLKAAKDGAVTQRNDGIVIIDPERARGQKQIMAACPYNHIWWNEELQLPQKWSFDAHLMDHEWPQPRPVQSCGTGALIAVKAEDTEMAERAEREGLEVLHEEYGTKPRVWYKNLYRFRDAFIAGSVSASIDGRCECATDAEVVLSNDGEIKVSIKTDSFGDFKFDRLLLNSGEYSLQVQYKDWPPYSQSLVLGKSVNLGEINLGEKK